MILLFKGVSYLYMDYSEYHIIRREKSKLKNSYGFQTNYKYMVR